MKPTLGSRQPLHIGPLAAQVNEIRRRFGNDTDPGDAFIVNHPYQAGQNHSTDVTVISPIFVGRRIAGYIGNIAHKTRSLLEWDGKGERFTNSESTHLQLSAHNAKSASNGLSDHL